MVAILALIDIPAILSLALAIVALAYLLGVWASGAMYGGLLSSMARYIPFVGGFIADAIGNVTGGITGIIAGAADGAAYPLVRLISVLAQLVTVAADLIAAPIEWTVGRLIDLYSRLSSMALEILSNSLAFSLQLLALSGALSVLSASIAALQAQASWLIQTFIPSAMATAVNNALAAMGPIITAAVTPIWAALTAEVLRATAGEVNLNNAVAAIDTTIDTKVWPAIDGLINDWQTILPLALPLTYPLALSSIATIEMTLSNAMTECVNPTCNALAPFMSMLNILGDVTMYAAVGAFVGAAVRDPDGTAHEVAGLADSILGMGRGLVDDFTGLNL